MTATPPRLAFEPPAPRPPARDEARPAATLIAVAGAVVRAQVTTALSLGEVVRVGEAELLGEVVSLDHDVAVLQVYEDTAGLAPGGSVHGTGAPLAVELGPGLLGGVFDGIQRPLEALARAEGDFLRRGVHAPALDRERRWPFQPTASAGVAVTPGFELGTVQETPAVLHRILVPPGVEGTLRWLAEPVEVDVLTPIAWVARPSGTLVEIPLRQLWPVRVARPVRERLPLSVPMVTGQRVLDTFFPLARGAAAGLPGGFGTGKTVLLHQLAKWAAADVIVYVGCGERGNEMTRMLRELPGLVDPRTGAPLAQRTVLIANTSNMPVSAREASLYTGITVAEYYRDMGYHVALIADSTSRWAEALREISGRLGEIPAEEGYPSYLASRLAAYYERAGRVVGVGGREGSLTLISAISPPGGDLTDPVTRHTQALARVFWALDRELASARLFPAVSIEGSYADIPAEMDAWWRKEASPAWVEQRRAALELLEEAARLEATARMIGEDSLPPRQRLILATAKLLQEGFLQQSAFDRVDASCAPARQAALLRLFLRLRTEAERALGRGVPVARLLALPLLQDVVRARERYVDAEVTRIHALEEELAAACAALPAEGVLEGAA